LAYYYFVHVLNLQNLSQCHPLNGTEFVWWCIIHQSFVGLALLGRGRAWTVRCSTSSHIPSLQYPFERGSFMCSLTSFLAAAKCRTITTSLDCLLVCVVFSYDVLSICQRCGPAEFFSHECSLFLTHYMYSCNAENAKRYSVSVSLLSYASSFIKFHALF